MQHNESDFKEMLEEYDDTTLRSGDFLNTLNLQSHREQIPAQAPVRRALARKKSRDFDEMDIELDAKEERLANLASKGKPAPKQTRVPLSTKSSNLPRSAISKGGMLAQQNRLAPKSSLSKSTTSANLLDQLEAFNIVQPKTTAGLSRSNSIVELPAASASSRRKPAPSQPELANPYYASHMDLNGAVVRMHDTAIQASDAFGGMVDKDVSPLAKASKHAHEDREHRLRKICRELNYIWFFLGNGRRGWILTEMPHDFFLATIPKIEQAVASLRQLVKVPCLSWLHGKALDPAASVGRKLNRILGHRRQLALEAEDELLAQRLKNEMEAEHSDRDGDLGMDGSMGFGTQTAPARGMKYRQATAEDDEMDED